MDKKFIIYVVQIITMLFWVSFLENSDSYFTPYLFIAVLAFVCAHVNNREKFILRERREKLLSISAGIFSFMVLAANYQLLSGNNLPDYTSSIFILLHEFVTLLLVVVGGYFIAWNILYYFSKKLKRFVWKNSNNKINPIIIFFVSFLSISALYITILFTCKYPGNLTPDSVDQIGQLLTGNYSNHHPFYHTITIKIFIMFGLKIFNDINAAVALYNVFQVLFMSACFSAVTFTLYEAGISLKLIVVLIIWYMLMPFHIMYSFTIWKDVMFGGFLLLFLVSIFRFLNNKKTYKIFTYIIFMISGLGICLFRSNGFFAFILTFIAFVILFWKNKKNICVMFAAIIVVSFLMKHLVLSNLGIRQPDTIEALSIPAQQIARVIVENDDFTNKQKEILGRIVDIDAVKEEYLPYISDPIKKLVRSKGNQQYLVNDKFCYIKLYINIGLKHPLTYFKAWIDETKGFWNGGYQYWRWAGSVYENEYGIKRTVNSEKISRCFSEYLWLFENNSFLQLLLCIGFYVWIDLFLCFISIKRKDKTGLFMSIPALAVIISLLVSTPVYSEFRYAYAIFCSLPFIIFAVFYKDSSGGRGIYG